MTSKDMRSRMAPRTKAAPRVAETFTEANQDTVQTSIRLPEDLHQQARFYAIEHKISLNKLVIEGLTARLKQKIIWLVFLVGIPAKNISYMIPGCHSVVASWDHGGAKRVCLFKRPQAFSCWGASDSPPNPLLAQQQARLVVASKAVGHQSRWPGMWSPHPLTSPHWRAG